MIVPSGPTCRDAVPSPFGRDGAAVGDLGICHRCGGRTACCLICGNRGVEPIDRAGLIFVGEGPDPDEFDS